MVTPRCFLRAPSTSIRKGATLMEVLPSSRGRGVKIGQPLRRRLTEPAVFFVLPSRSAAGPQREALHTRSQGGSAGASSAEGAPHDGRAAPATPAQSSERPQTRRLLAASQSAAQCVPSASGVVQQRSPVAQSVGREQRRAALLPSCARSWISASPAQRVALALTRQYGVSAGQRRPSQVAPAVVIGADTAEAATVAGSRAGPAEHADANAAATIGV